MQNQLNFKHPVVTINIKSFGTIKVELYPELAPNTVKNFIKHVNHQFYDGLIFHRIIPSFMIQGGWGKTPACRIAGEFSANGFENLIKHHRGVISMARTSDPNSATTQFFIMHKDAPHLDGQYAAFGKVIEGIEVVDQIATQKRDANDKPLEDVIMTSVTVDLKGQTFEDPICHSHQF
jgi:peptidyl-prolyl cis-trans isomerase B (cyclophilin B)